MLVRDQRYEHRDLLRGILRCTTQVPVIVNASGPVMPGQAQAGTGLRRVHVPTNSTRKAVPVAAPNQDYTGSWAYAPNSPEMGPTENFGYDPYTDMATWLRDPT